MTEENITFICENIGVAGTTKCHVQKRQDGKYEARMGFSIMGSTNMSDEQFERAEHNPFHSQFYDNYALGIDDTQELAISAMKADIKSICDSLWAF